MTYDELIDSILIAQEQMLKHDIEANSVTLNGRKYGKLIENVPPNMKPTVFGMAVKADYALPDDYDFLVQYEPPQPKTKADCIRQMSDEELAELISSDWCEIICSPNTNCQYEDCRGKILGWLKQEAE